MCDPLYHSPNGSHLQKYLKQPWRHLEDPISILRDQVITEAARTPQLRDWEQFLELNRFSAQEMIRTVEAAGFKTVRRQLFKTESEPPARLKEVYSAEVLTTTGLQALFR